MASKEFENRPGSVWERYDVGNHPIEEARADMEKMAIDSLKSYQDVSWEPGKCGALSGKWIHPAKESDLVLYYIHGGGFTHGSSGIPMPFLLEMTHRLQINSFSADYRKAPENKFPAAPEDALAGYKGLLELGYKPENIIICGESAGATLSLDVPLMCKEQGLANPAAIIAMSPACDFVGGVEGTVLEGLSGPSEIMDMYAPGVALDHPLISPALGDLEGFPPTFLSVGATEVLLADSISFATHASAKNVDVRLHIGQDMIHTYPLDLWDYPEAMVAFEEMELFMRQIWGMK